MPRPVLDRRPVMPMPMPMPMPPVAPGAAAPARSSSAPWIVAAAAIVVLAVVGAVLVVLVRPVSSGGAAPIAPAVPAPVTVTVAPSTTSSASSATGSASTLQTVVDADRSSVESLDGMWVAQLSSKRPGTVDNGTTYDSSSIYQHYTALAAAHPGALLLWSGDWSVYRESDYWVVIAGQGFTTADGANAWCGAQGFAPDDCFAKRLSPHRRPGRHHPAPFLSHPDPETREHRVPRLPDLSVLFPFGAWLRHPALRSWTTSEAPSRRYW